VTAPERRTLVIGYGSPIRGDDALGPLAAERLCEAGLPAGVEVISRHVLTAELAPDIAAAGLVIFLDAAADVEPGVVSRRTLRPDATTLSTMAHFLDPRELMAWAETLYGHCPVCHLVSAGGDRFDYAGYELTPVAQRALTAMIDTVRDLLDDHGPSPEPPVPDAPSSTSLPR
jgi:hydrogenase maturation protease